MAHIIADYEKIEGKANIIVLAEKFTPAASTTTFDCSKIQGYENLTEANFYLVFVGSEWGTYPYQSSNGQGSYGGYFYSASLSYNNSTGVLTVTNPYWRAGGNYSGWASGNIPYNLFCAY